MKKRAFRIREARRADADGMARVLFDCWQTNYRGIVPRAHLDAMTLAERKGTLLREFDWMEQHADRAFFIAEAAGEIAGFVGGGKERGGHPDFDGELYGIYVAPHRQRAGLGRALFLHLVQWLQSEGYTGFLLWTFRDNAPARLFYEALGGRLLAERRRFECAGAELDLVAYGWDDIAALIETMEILLSR